MSIVIVDGDQRCSISHLNAHTIDRLRTERIILSAFRFSDEKLTSRDIMKRTEMKETSIRNHIHRMVKNGTLKKTYVRQINYNLCHYEVVG